MNQSYLGEKYILGRGGPPIVPLSGKKYQKFPSGLIRIDQEFVSLKTEAGIGTAREVFIAGNIMPGSESLRNPAYIYPQASESYDTPGFCKFSVSAYSKEGGPYGQIIRNAQIVALSESRSVPSPTEANPDREITYTVNERWLVDTATFVGVIESDGEILQFGIDLDKKLLSRYQNTIDTSTRAQGGISINWVPGIVSVTRKNFGRYDEFEATQTLIPIY